MGKKSDATSVIPHQEWGAKAEAAVIAVRWAVSEKKPGRLKMAQIYGVASTALESEPMAILEEALWYNPYSSIMRPARPPRF